MKKKQPIKKPAAPGEAYPIRKDVPLPQYTKGPRAAPRYPLAQMKRGDSFVVPSDEKVTIRAAIKMHNRALRAGKSGLLFQTRTLEDGRIGVWLEKKD